MPQLEDQLRDEVKRIIDKPLPEPSKAPEIETENIFDPDLEKPDPKFLEEMEGFLDNPMNMVMKVLTNYLDSLKPRIPEPIKSEHKVRIFRLNDRTVLAEVEAQIEAFLNDGYCCHMPTTCNDFLMMDFSRRKETEENGKQ